MRFDVIKNSIPTTGFRPLMVAILILSGTLSSINIPLAGYAQSDTDYDAREVSSDGSTFDDMVMDEGQNSDVESSDASDGNDRMDDFSLVSTDETAADNGIDSNQDSTNSSGDNLPTDATQDSDPIADAGKDIEVDENTDVSLDGSASVDQDGEISSYSWEQTDGYPLAELKDADYVQPSFTAPNLDSDQELTFQLSVTDNDGLTDTDSVIVLVKDITQPEVPEDNAEPSVPDEQDTEPKCVENEPGCEPSQGPPIIDPCVGNATNVDCVIPGQEPPVIDPCIGNDVDADCIVPGQGPPIISEIPECPDGNMTRDGCIEPSEPTTDCPNGNMTEEAGCIVPSEPTPDCPNGNMTGNFTDCPPSEGNIPPVADAGKDQVVDENSAVILDGINSYDSDGNITSYSWIQTEGEPSVTLVDANNPSASFLVPSIEDNSTVTVELTVTDNSGNRDSDYVDISIENTNKTEIPPITGKITLDRIPNTVEPGSIFVFSGRLSISGNNNYTDVYVQIKDFNNGSDDDLLSFNTADMDGRFVSQWTATPKEQPYKVYAIYDDGYGNILKSNIQSFNVNESRIQYQFESERVAERPYIPIIFNDYKSSALNVYVLAKDKSSEPYVPTAIEAIEHWSEVLQKRSGNPNAWKFKIITDRDLPTFQFEKYRPHIIVNLEHKNSQSECGQFGGCAHIGWPQRLSNGHVVTWVFTGAGSQNFKHEWVKYITSHEFGHALGLGHTWNEGNRADKTEDMMCSSDNRLNILGIIPIGKLVRTCNVPNDVYKDSGRPTEFNIRAVLYAYGIDGFQSPNRFLIPFINDYYACEPLPDDCKPKDIESPPDIVTTPTRRSEEDMQQVDKKITTTKSTNKKVTTQTDTKDSTTASKSEEAPNVEYRFVSKIGFPGTGKGQLLEPTDLSIDVKHDIMYVTDKNNNRIQKLDTNGNYLTSWGSQGSGLGKFVSPADLAVDFPANIIFVADLGNNRIQKFDTNGNFATMWGSSGKGFGEFDHVGDIALDTKGQFVYVTDIGNHRVQKFGYDGKFISSWGSLGTGDGRFDRPAGIDYDSSGNIYVVDTNNNRIQKFDSGGTFLGMWGNYGKGPGQFDNPVSLNIDSASNYLYVSDAGNKRIVIFDHNGKYLGGWGIDGGDDGEFERPVSVAFGNNGKVYVVDKDRGDIQIFTNSKINTVYSSRTTDSTSNSAPTIRQFSAKLSSSEEVPPTDSEALGAASFRVNDNLISYKIEVSGMDDVFGAHLHKGEKNTNGDIVAALTTGEQVEGSISSSDLTGPLEGKIIKDIVELMEKGSIYVNLHSNTFPDGEIRGVVKPVTVSSSPSQTKIQPDAQLVSVVAYNAKKQMGTLNICAFDGTEPISDCVKANIGKLADTNKSDRFEAALLKVKTDKNLGENDDLIVCFDPLSNQRYSWGGCWDIQRTPEGKLYTEYDMTGLN